MTNPPPEEIGSLLDQNFYYMGKGSQCFVFESEDKQSVLKFFRLNRYRVPKITQLLSFPAFLHSIQQEKQERKQYKLDALFHSCKIAFEELHEESGLLYLHLNKTSHINKKITLYDRLKRTYTINSDEYAFLIQKRGEQDYPYLTHLLEKGKKKEAQEALSHLASILSNRLRKGIADHDPVIQKNSGFRGNKALFLDVGEFAHEPCADPKQELWHMTEELRSWLNLHDADLASDFENQLTLFSQNVHTYRQPPPVYQQTPALR